jgi:TonB family protein
MRRMILTSVVLLPVMAQAATVTSTEPKPSTSSAMLSVAADTGSHTAVREFIRTQMVDNSMLVAAVREPGTLNFALKGSMATEASAPKLTRAVEVELSDSELAEQPAVSNVVVRAIVDENGVPRNVQVTQSGGSLIDRKVLAAVNQYRFKPATVDNRATWATVSIAIKIQK